jgi:hypothetical protein
MTSFKSPQLVYDELNFPHSAEVATSSRSLQDTQVGALPVDKQFAVGSSSLLLLIRSRSRAGLQTGGAIAFGLQVRNWGVPSVRELML